MVVLPPVSETSLPFVYLGGGFLIKGSPVFFLGRGGREPCGVDQPLAVVVLSQTKNLLTWGAPEELEPCARFGSDCGGTGLPRGDGMGAAGGRVGGTSPRTSMAEGSVAGFGGLWALGARGARISNCGSLI